MAITQEQQIQLLQGAIRVAARMVSQNPPIDLGSYDAEMMRCLTAGDQKELAWELYFMRQAVKELNIDLL